MVGEARILMPQSGGWIFRRFARQPKTGKF
jgi:hypothetical protein